MGAPPSRVLCGGWDTTPPGVTGFPKPSPHAELSHPIPILELRPNFPHYFLDFTLRYILCLVYIPHRNRQNAPVLPQEFPFQAQSRPATPLFPRFCLQPQSIHRFTRIRDFFSGVVPCPFP